MLNGSNDVLSPQAASPAARPDRPAVLLIGDFRHRDFSAAVQWLQANTRVRCVPEMSAALASLETALPAVILFAQARPGQFSPRQVEQIHARSPLSRLVVLLGSWCEGETRTGRPWPGVVRVFWHQWHCRLASELAACRIDANPPVPPAWGAWRLPRTASTSELLACTVAGPWPRGRGLVVIRARLLGDYEALRDACTAGGYASLWDPSVVPAVSSRPAAALFSAVSGSPDELVELAELVRRHEPAPVIVLLDFLRRNDHQQAIAAGAAAVLAKPFLVPDLLWNLDHHIRNTRDDRAGQAA